MCKRRSARPVIGWRGVAEKDQRRPGSSEGADEVAAADVVAETVPGRGSVGGAATAVGVDARDSDALEALLSAVHQPGPATEGTLLDRFVVEEELGRGGMGVVLSARDPELDRKVAIKVLHREADGSESSGAEARLLREAQALAKLSHPNVVAVHEVGTIGREIFVVMEYVRGETLAEWLTTGDRTWQEIIATFRQAGLGLAAAHGAGLVHRDFKPSNVLIGRDGRVRVADFGLVGASGSAGDEGNGAPVEARLSPTTPLGASLTLTGTLLGTPLYMAPEQHARGQVDARADQFAFCVALYEALFRERPFAGDSYQDLSASVGKGEVRPMPRETEVPARLRSAVLRGLRTDPEERFPSMNELLEALASGRPSAGKRGLLAVAAAVLAAGLAATAAVWSLRGAERDVCAQPQETWRGSWDGEVRQQVRDAFDATGKPYAGQTFERVAGLLDAYVRGWGTMRTEACRATRSHGDRADELFDLRMHCLNRRRAEVGALTAMMASGPDVELLDKAVRAVSGLSPLAACADEKRLKAAVPLPEAPELRAQVAALQVRLDEAAAAENAGRYARAVEVATAVVEAASKIDYQPLRAEAGFLLGKSLNKIGTPEAAARTLRRAVQMAAEAEDDLLAARAWIELIYVVGDGQKLAGEALALRGSAEAAVARAGSPAELRGRLLHTLGTVSNVAGDFAGAEALLREALALRENAFGKRHFTVAASATNLGLTVWRQGRADEALPLFQRALGLLEEVFGTGHPDVAKAHNNLSNVLKQSGEYDEAEKHLRRAIAIWEAAFGSEHPNLARPLSNLANLHYSRGDLEAAQAMFGRALEILETKLGPDHPDVSLVVHNLGNLLADRGDYDAALSAYRRALSIRERAFGVEHQRVASTAGALGSLLVSLEQPIEGQPLLERALAIDEKVFGPEHPNVAYSLVSLGQAYVARGRPRDALALLERALAIRTKTKADATELAECEFGLAAALWDARRDRDRAKRLARSARDHYVAAGQSAAKQLAKVEAWLRARRPGRGLKRSRK